MLKIIIILTIAAVTSGDKRCHGVYIDNSYYNLDIIKDGINNIHDLVINRNDNSLYFTFDDVSKTPKRLLGNIDMNTKIAHVVDGVPNATAIAIDQFYNKIYVGGSDGLFKINGQNVPERLPIHDDIRYMHYKDNLYFINKKKEAFKFEDGFATPVQELQGMAVDSLVLDDDNNIFFTQNKKLFKIKLGTRAVNSLENYVVNVLVTDSYSKANICTKNGFYKYNKYKYVFDKTADFNNLKAITFNKVNEPIYAVADYIVKLSLSSIGCFED